MEGLGDAAEAMGRQLIARVAGGDDNEPDHVRVGDEHPRQRFRTDEFGAAVGAVEGEAKAPARVVASVAEEVEGVDRLAAVISLGEGLGELLKRGVGEGLELRGEPVVACLGRTECPTGRRTDRLLVLDRRDGSAGGRPGEEDPSCQGRSAPAAGRRAGPLVA